MVLDLLGARSDLIEVPYSDRNEIARITGGYAYVPVLVDDAGRAIIESRDICEYLLSGEAGVLACPAAIAGAHLGVR
jgi:glutathione S-transferase